MIGGLILAGVLGLGTLIALGGRDRPRPRPVPVRAPESGKNRPRRRW